VTVCCVAERLDNFVIGLTNDNPAVAEPIYKMSYAVCGQFNGSVAPSVNGTVECALSSEKFRYVIVQGSWDDTYALCLTEVYVFLRRK